MLINVWIVVRRFKLTGEKNTRADVVGEVTLQLALLPVDFASDEPLDVDELKLLTSVAVAPVAKYCFAIEERRLWI